MSEFQKLQEDWWEYLKESGDISSKQHLRFLKILQTLLRKNFEREDIPESSFYIQQHAWFYRFRILELLTGMGEKYQVNFHLFPEGETHIHSHGYEWNSFVLEGELMYRNFIPQKVDPQRQRDLETILPYAFAGREDPQRVAEQVFRELEELFLWQRTKISFNTKVFAAFISGGDDEDFWKFTLPSDIMNLLRDAKGMFYELRNSQSGTVKKWENYTVGLHEAHKIMVPEQALTLFLTKAPVPDTHTLSWWEYYHFRLPQIKTVRDTSSQHARDILCGALSRIKI